MTERYTLYAGGFEHDSFTSNMPLVIGRMDRRNGQMQALDTVEGRYNYGYLCQSHAGGNLYAVNTRLDEGALVSYAVLPDGGLRFQNELTLPFGAHGLHCAVSRHDRYALVACCASHNVYVCELDADGAAIRVSDVYAMPPGKGTLPRQAEGPVAHQVCFDPSGRFVFLPDINADRVLVLAFDEENGKLRYLSQVSVPAGEGPRHAVADAGGRHLYLITEMGCSVFSFDFNERMGELELTGRVALVPEAARAACEVQAGDIRLCPDGRFVFASTRGYLGDDGCDRLFSIALDAETGALGAPQSHSSLGLCPRMFDFTPDGKWLLVGNKFSDEIACLRYNADAGAPLATQRRLMAPSVAAFAVL